MTIYQFLAECKKLWPEKEITNDQKEFYEIKLSNFSDAEVGKIFDWLTDHSKYFPKVADIMDAARHCGFMDRVKGYEPHCWESGECRLCGGSGRLAVFFEILIDRENGGIIRNLKRIMQYEASQTTNRQQQDWTRFLFRCSCPAGEAKTLESGVPRWRAA